MNSPGDITQLIDRLGNQNAPDRRAVLDQLLPLLYGELKELARSNRYRWQGRGGHGTTSLVHEAYTRLASHAEGRFQNRRQFYALASRTMRTILIDNVKHRSRLKRGGDRVEVDLDWDLVGSPDRSAELLALDEALDQLGQKEPELAKIVECRCFGGLTIEQTAEALDVSPATIKRKWALARAWLYRRLSPEVVPEITVSLSDS